MNSEVSELMKEAHRKRSLWDKVRHHWNYSMISQSDLARMRKSLITDAKPLFKAWTLLPGTADEVDQMSIAWFDKRVATWKKATIVHLYQRLGQFKRAQSQEAKEYTLLGLVLDLQLSYNQDGWFTDNLFKAAQAGKINKLNLMKRLIRV